MKKKTFISALISSCSGLTGDLKTQSKAYTVTFSDLGEIFLTMRQKHILDRHYQV